MNYLVYDVEYRRDLEGHALYRASERYDDRDRRRLDDKDPLLVARWPFKQPVCISWLVMGLEGNHLLPQGEMRTIGLPERDEADMLGEFLTAVREQGKHMNLVTWGGSSSDEVQLRMAAMRNGLTLPRGMSVAMQPGSRFDAHHIDLMVQLGGNGARVHLAEVCAALRIPAKTVCAPTQIAALVDRRCWPDVKAVCEGDVLSTAAVLIHALHANQGEFGLMGSLRGLARYGARRDFRPYAPHFEEWAQALIPQEVARCFAAPEELAA